MTANMPQPELPSGKPSASVDSVLAAFNLCIAVTTESRDKAWSAFLATPNNTDEEREGEVTYEAWDSALFQLEQERTKYLEAKRGRSS